MVCALLVMTAAVADVLLSLGSVAGLLTGALMRHRHQDLFGRDDIATYVTGIDIKTTRF